MPVFNGIFSVQNFTLFNKNISSVLLKLQVVINVFIIIQFLCSGMKENIPGLGEELENQEMEEEEENDKLALLEETKAGFQLNKLLCTLEFHENCGKFEIVELTGNKNCVLCLFLFDFQAIRKTKAT